MKCFTDPANSHCVQLYYFFRFFSWVFTKWFCSHFFFFFLNSFKGWAPVFLVNAMGHYTKRAFFIIPSHYIVHVCKCQKGIFTMAVPRGYIGWKKIQFTIMGIMKNGFLWKSLGVACLMISLRRLQGQKPLGPAAISFWPCNSLGITFTTLPSRLFQRMYPNYHPRTKIKKFLNSNIFWWEICSLEMLFDSTFCFKNTSTQLTGISFKCLFDMANHIYV